ncbi:signal peptidase I [Flavobacterium nitrogenifigens]|uniref:Signal peptidase I n=2 Tax=Flavobacterium TaxID=237 RepID=A0A7W7IZB2_9FLAO|nr:MULTISPECIES: signal peptidase I [Flavobacterium]MBB4803068.1 signal peptidase I [Flavobacterium nitrogenifigens]MBB6388026.1 signal peptidase I [Flavobacterium notoginsengisoli]
MNDTTTKTNSRNPILVFFLSIFFSGFGQMYNGQLKKGIVFLLISFIYPILYGFTRIGVSFTGFFAIVIIDFAFRFYVIYDAVKNARKLKTYTLKPYNTWYYYAIYIVTTSVLFWYYDYNKIVGVQSYLIPSAGNEPTVKLGDRVVADLRAFNNTEPDYGDIVIFKKKDSLNPWIYRIVALPNDNVEIRHGSLIINGRKCKTRFIKETKSEEFDVYEHEEELPNGHKHKIYTFKTPFEEDKSAINKVTVPSNGYFLLGDNRDNAVDSRYIGVIYKDELMGKLVFSFLGKTNDRIHIDFRDQ